MSSFLLLLGCDLSGTKTVSLGETPDTGSPYYCTVQDETCDGRDNDCDGDIDEDGVCDVSTGDSTDSVNAESGDTTSDTVEPVDQDGDGYPVGEDCDDTDPQVNPGAYEVYFDPAEPDSGRLYCGDGIDNDCDGNVDTADTQCADVDRDGIPDGVDYLFPCDIDGDGDSEAACIRTGLWSEPWSGADCIQQIGTFTNLSVSSTNRLQTLTWGGETLEVCPIYPTIASSSVDARAVSTLGMDASTTVDLNDCRDWVPANLDTYCRALPDALCSNSSLSDDCETLGYILSFAYDGTSVTP